MGNVAECHVCNCFVNPPCGACENCKHWDVSDCSKDCQTCEYDHWRTGPYHLTDGTWSDGVDRDEPLSVWTRPNGRWQVYQCESGYWEAYAESGGQQLDEIDSFATYAEAIAYADRMARTNQGDVS